MAEIENTEDQDAVTEFVENLTTEEKLKMLQEAVLSYEDTIADVQKKHDLMLQQLQRTTADFENFRKRAKKDQELATQRVARSFLEQLVPIMDNLDYAIGAIPADQEVLAKPMQMLQNAFLKVFADNDIARIEPQLGEPFDPEVHQAVSVVLKEIDSQVVGYVARPGYSIGGQVFRPSDVIVHQPKSNE